MSKKNSSFFCLPINMSQNDLNVCDITLMSYYYVQYLIAGTDNTLLHPDVGPHMDVNKENQALVAANSFPSNVSSSNFA